MSNAMLRKVKGRENPYAQVPKAMLDDVALTWEAKGLLSYLIGKPDDWTVMVVDLVKHAANGRDAVYTILQELRDQGYMQRVQLINQKGHKAGTEYRVAEYPAFLGAPIITERIHTVQDGTPTASWKSGSGAPVSGASGSGKADATKNEVTKTEKTTKKEGKKTRAQRASPSPFEGSEQAQNLLEVYNAHRGRLGEATKLNQARQDALDQLLEEYSGNLDAATEALKLATQFVAGDQFWHDNAYNLDNLLKKAGRVTEKADKQRAKVGISKPSHGSGKGSGGAAGAAPAALKTGALWRTQDHQPVEIASLTRNGAGQVTTVELYAPGGQFQPVALADFLRDYVPLGA